MTTKKLKTEKQIKMAYFDQKPFSRSNSRSKLSKRAITPKDVTLKNGIYFQAIDTSKAEVHRIPLHA